jgi:hypothetical protein
LWPVCWHAFRSASHSDDDSIGLPTSASRPSSTPAARHHCVGGANHFQRSPHSPSSANLAGRPVRPLKRHRPLSLRWAQRWRCTRSAATS